MKTISIFALLLVLNITLIAQDSGRIVATIKGKVINIATNEPVSYTNIGIEGTFFGTASDAEGNFELKIPEELASKNIFFSAVGFKNKQFPVKDLFEKEFNVIKIESQSYGIDDIDIAAQNMVLIRILRMASENIPYNFIQGPLNLTGTYTREKVVDTITTNQNAEVLIYDKTGYAKPSKDNAFSSVKYSLNMKDTEKAYRFSSGSTSMDELLEFDWARTATSVLDPALSFGFQLKLVDEPVLNGREFWVISFAQKKPTLAGSGDYYASSFEGEITIDKEDYAVIKIDGKVQSPKNNLQGKSLAIGSQSKDYIENVDYEFSVDYQNLKPSAISMNKSYLYKGKKITENSTLQINNVQTTNITELDSRQYFTGK